MPLSSRGACPQVRAVTTPAGAPLPSGAICRPGIVVHVRLWAVLERGRAPSSQWRDFLHKNRLAVKFSNLRASPVPVQRDESRTSRDFGCAHVATVKESFKKAARLKPWRLSEGSGGTQFSIHPSASWVVGAKLSHQDAPCSSMNVTRPLLNPRAFFGAKASSRCARYSRTAQERSRGRNGGEHKSFEQPFVEHVGCTARQQTPKLERKRSAEASASWL